MDIDNQIQLRPRFEKSVPKSLITIIANAKELSNSLKPDFIINNLDEHIWIYIGKENKKTYSPHLHLELEELHEGGTKIKGLFGPEPALWTMFMFLHFVVAGIFIIFGVFAYSNWSLGEPFGIHLGVMMLMIIAWFSLYFTARSNRKKGMPQARELEKVMNQLLEAE
ncbi:MAG: hypothetical protein NXH73_04035 [Flavobacteriaceae bacterium]|nr:hypothetical protein [Flavobacteriaceae bacterium]